MSSSIASPQGSPRPTDSSPILARLAGSSARADLPSVAQLTRRHTAPTTSPERPPKAPNPNRGHFQPYRPVSSPPSSPNVPFRPPSSRVASSSSVPASQLSLPTQPTDADPDAEFVHPPFDKRTNYMFIVGAKSPSKFLDQKDFIGEDGEVLMEYPYQLEPIRGLGGLKPGPVDDKDVLRCTFCRKQYRGKNSKSMWRRHVQKSHKIKLKNYRERNKENEIEEDFMAATPSRPKLSPYPQLFTARSEPVQQQQPVLMLGRMPLLDAVMNKNISPADAKKVAALAVASVTANASGNPFKMVLKPPIKPEPMVTSLPSAPVVKKETKKPAKAPAPKPAPEPESPVLAEPEFTLSGSDDDDDTETRRVPCPHAELPCEGCVEEYKSLKRGVRRTASFMMLLPDSPRFDFADGEMSVDVDMDGERSEDEWLYDPGSDAILEPAAPSSPAGLGFGFFNLGLPPPLDMPAPVDPADDALASEADSWLQWDAAEPVVATAV